MLHRPAVLIVSASAGSGHVRAGTALEEAFAERGAVDVVHVDVLELAPRWVRSAYGGGFELLASRAPGVWREVYARTDGADADHARWAPLARRLLFREFRRLLHARPWSACVCTHFLPGQLAAGTPGAPPFVSVITDFTLHRYWVNPRVALYFTPTPEVVHDVRRRLPHVTAIASGIPVASGFSQRPDRYAAQRTLDLPPGRRVVLVMGGGVGLGMEDTVRAVLRGSTDACVVAVCGHNAGAEERLRALSLGVGADRLRVLGYTTDVPLLMNAADIVVTKPGGLTCSEALAVGRPLVLTRAIPGHEEANVRYLAGRGAAVHAPDESRTAAAVESLLGNAGVLASATFSAAAAGTPGAARAVAEAVQRRFSRSRMVA